MGELIDRAELERFAMDQVGGCVDLMQIHSFQAARTEKTEEGRAMTNGDKWRKMTDREIARWIVRMLPCSACPYYSQVFTECSIDTNSREECWDAVEKWCKEETMA